MAETQPQILLSRHINRLGGNKDVKMKREISVIKRTFLSVFSIAVLFFMASCSYWFEQKVPMDNSKSNSDLSGLFSYREGKIKLKSPEQVFASEGIFPGKIDVRWKEVENAASYVLERAVSVPDEDGNYKLPEDEEFETISRAVYGTKYEDTILSEPGFSNKEYSYRYYYRVSAENIGKGYVASEFSKISKTSNQGLGYLFAPPQKVVAWKGKSITEVQVSWEAVKDSVRYNIYRTEKSNGTGSELIGKVIGSALTFTNEISSKEQGVEFFYRIAAVNSHGKESAFSSVAMGYSLMEGSPASPDGVKVVDGFGTSQKALTVSWQPVTAPAGKTVLYNVYRSSSENSVITLVKSRLSPTSYIDKSNLKPGLFYYYYIMTILVSTNSDGSTSELKSGFSESGPDSKEPAYGFLLSPPSVISVPDEGNLSEGNVFLKWKPALGADLVSTPFVYNIYYSQTLTDAFTLIQANVPPTVSTDGYISVEIKKYNYYKISSVNSANLESVLSEVAAPHPSAPTNVVASKNVILDTAWIPNVNEVYPVKITWEPPANESPASYAVYRSTSPDGSYKRVQVVTDTFCVDTNPAAKAGTMFYYKVVPLNIQNQGSHSNAPATDSKFDSRGYGAITGNQWFREYSKTISHSHSKLTLMHKSKDTDKLGSESVGGDFGGTLSYSARIAGLGAEIKMPYSSYSDFYCGDNGKLYIGDKNGYSGEDAYSKVPEKEKARCVEYFILTGSMDTSTNMSANGNMSNTVSCKGMYPGKAEYGNIKIVGGVAAGGYYLVTTYGPDGKILLENNKVDYSIGEEKNDYSHGK